MLYNPFRERTAISDAVRLREFAGPVDDFAFVHVIPSLHLRLDVLVRGKIGEFLNFAQEFLVLRGLFLRIVQVFEQAGKAYEIIANR